MKLAGKTITVYPIDDVPPVEIPIWASWDMKKVYFPKLSDKL